jgi:hypothetical protein
MACHASTAAWDAGSNQHSRCRPRKRGLEIAGIILGFIFVWPLALAYLVWKLLGYPVPNEAKEFFEKHFSRLSESFGGAFGSGKGPGPSYSRTGNFAFEEYRKRELARLEEERQRLEQEAHAFAEFVEELKRARDREEFEAFKTKHRQGPAAA